MNASDMSPAVIMAMALPFFNMEMSNRGVILGIGWTGQWFAARGRAGYHQQHHRTHRQTNQECRVGVLQQAVLAVCIDAEQVELARHILVDALVIAQQTGHDLRVFADVQR